MMKISGVDGFTCKFCHAIKKEITSIWCKLQENRGVENIMRPAQIQHQKLTKF